MRVVRYAIRNLRRSPGFTFTTALVLTLAVGASTTTFALLNALVIRELPVLNPGELVQLHTRDRLGREADLTWRQFQELTRQQRVFAAVLGWIAQGVFTVETKNGEQRRSVTGASGNFFDELGARPVIGRLIQAADVSIDSAGSQPVVVLGWTFWQEHFGGNPDVIGDSLRLQGIPLEIIGVAPPGFRGLGITIESDLTIPLTLVPKISEAEAAMLKGTVRWVAATGRLAPEHTLDSVRAQLSAAWPAIQAAAAPPTLQGALLQEYRDTRLEVNSGSRGVERGLRGRYVRPLSVLLGVAALVLLASAVNVSSLIFARMDARQHEMAVRLALGVRRIRLIAEMASEGALLGALGAIGGIAFASYASKAIASLLLQDYVVRTSLDVTPDGFVIAVAGLAAVATGFTVAALAAYIVLRSRATVTMRIGSRSVARSWRVGRAMVGAQIAVSLVLVAHASLFARSLQKLEATPSGVTAETVLVGYPQQRVGTYERTDPFAYYQQALSRLRTLPGVAAAAFSRARPQGGALPLQSVGVARSAPESGTPAEIAAVSPGFFDALGLEVVAGRDITFVDDERAPRVAVISQAVEARLFGTGQGLGKQIRLSADPHWQQTTVVGVVRDARVFDVRGGNKSIVYTPALQLGSLAHFKYLVVRAPTTSSREVQQALESLGVELLPGVQSLSYIRGRTILQERVLAGLGGFFGLLGLLVVTVGLYGLMSYVLSLRRREIGVCMALGASSSHVARKILGDGLAVALGGMVVGMAAVLGSTRLLSSVLVDTSPFDPLAVGAACLAILSVTCAATAIPAVRASRVDPATELRRE